MADSNSSRATSLTILGLTLCLGFVIAALFMKGLVFQSLWLDECVTAWVIRDGFDAVIPRVLDHQGMSPVYFLFMFGWAKIFGSSEAMLRLPSILAIVGTIAILFQIGRKLSGTAAGLLAIILFLSPTIITSLSSVRPYGLAVFFSSLILLLMLDGDLEKRARAAGFILSCVFLPLLHPLYSLILLAVAISFLLDRGRWSKQSQHVIFWGVIVGGIISIIALLQSVALSAKVSISFAQNPTLFGLFDWLFPLGLSAPIALALVVSSIFAKEDLPNTESLFSMKKTILVWSLLAPSIFFCLAKFSIINLFVPRYAFWFYPAFCVLIAAACSANRNPLTRGLTQFFVALSALFLTVNLKFLPEDWRLAARLLQHENISSDTPVLVTSGLIEGRTASWLKQSANQEYYLSPALIYSVPGKLIAAPLDVDSAENKVYFSEEIAPLISASTSKLFYLFNLQTPGGQRLLETYVHQLKELGFELTKVSKDGLVRIAIFARPVK